MSATTEDLFPSLRIDPPDVSADAERLPPAVAGLAIFASTSALWAVLLWAGSYAVALL